MTVAVGACRIDAIPEGPILVRGATVLKDVKDGTHRIVRPVVAVCACGLSQRLPWCDGTHKVAVGADERFVVVCRGPHAVVQKA